MPRVKGRTAPVKNAPALPSTTPAFNIQIDTDKLEIGDLFLFTELQATGRSEAETQRLMFEALPMLDRITVGGIRARYGRLKLDQLPALMHAITAALGGAADTKN